MFRPRQDPGRRAVANHRGDAGVESAPRTVTRSAQTVQALWRLRGRSICGVDTAARLVEGVAALLVRYTAYLDTDQHVLLTRLLGAGGG